MAFGLVTNGHGHNCSQHFLLLLCPRVTITVNRWRFAANLNVFLRIFFNGNAILIRGTNGTKKSPLNGERFFLYASLCYFLINGIEIPPKWVIMEVNLLFEYNRIALGNCQKFPFCMAMGACVPSHTISIFETIRGRYQKDAEEGEKEKRFNINDVRNSKRNHRWKFAAEFRFLWPLSLDGQIFLFPHFKSCRMSKWIFRQFFLFLFFNFFRFPLYCWHLFRSNADDEIQFCVSYFMAFSIGHTKCSSSSNDHRR